ncbi:MAG: DUF488 domain-containing protein [Candidatus Promineifilaceae bacterium]
MTPKIITIGVYGFTEATFFEALQAHGVELFCDVRQRRGLRGRDFAFANSLRLQRRLDELGIAYVHLKNLAPPMKVRRQQQTVDQVGGIKKRARSRLSPTFVEAYEETVLADFDGRAFLDEVGKAAVLALFCVEREPEACHRSLLADHLAPSLEQEVEHVLP